MLTSVFNLLWLFCFCAPVVCRASGTSGGLPAAAAARTLVSCSRSGVSFLSSLEPRAPVCIL